MVNYIQPNLQEIIIGPIRVGLITQKQFWDHLKNCHPRGQMLGLVVEEVGDSLGFSLVACCGL